MDARIGGMPLCDYFSAADDEAAVAVLRYPGGPGSVEYDVVCLKGIDPVVSIARLEAVMTGCSYEEVGRRSKSGGVVSLPEEGPPFVVSVSDALTDALVTATRDDIVRCAELWSRTDELRQLHVDVEFAAGVLRNLAGLAQRARVSGSRLYCWWAL
ncbi:hypothetical protein [Streptomyces sp. NPDC054887]